MGIHALTGSASARLNPAAAAVTGTLSRNEKRAASSRFKPRNSPQVIVAPDLETPGTSAEACASPTPRPQRSSALWPAKKNSCG